MYYCTVRIFCIECHNIFNRLFFIIVFSDFVSMYFLRVNRWIERFHVCYVLVLCIPAVPQPWLQTAAIVIHNRASIHSQGTTDPTWNLMRYVQCSWTKYIFALLRFEEEVCLFKTRAPAFFILQTVHVNCSKTFLNRYQNIYLRQAWKFRFSSILLFLLLIHKLTITYDFNFVWYN